MKKEIILNVIGSFFLLMGIAAVLNAIYLKDYYGILWFCYAGLILIGISILKRNSYLLTAQLNILAIPLILWTIDFIYTLFNGQSIFGVVDYFFIRGPLFAKIISLQHLFTIPLSFYALYLIKIKREDTWKLSFAEIVVVYIITVILTPEANNINCVYGPCINFVPRFYTLFWFVSSFLMVFVTSFAINNIKFLRNRPKLVS